MKSTFRFLGIVVLSALIALTMTACGGDDEPVGGGGSNVTVTPTLLTLAGKVWTIESSMMGFSWKEFKGDVSIFSSTGSGAIDGGNLNFTIGVPNVNDFSPLSSFINYVFDYGYSISQNATEVSYYGIYYLNTNTSGYDDVQLMIYDMSVSRNLSEFVYFIYVDKPVTLTASGFTETDEDGYVTTNNSINIQFTQGWNAISVKYDANRSGATRSYTKLNSVSSSYTWVLSESYW